MRGLSNAFRGLADVLETLETNRTGETQIDISSVTPLSQDILATDTISTELEVRVPLFDSAICDKHSRLTAEDVQLTDDGALLVEFLVAVPPDEQTSEEVGSTESQLKNGNDSESKCDEIGPNTTNPTESEGDASRSDSTPDADGDVPAYRDPDRLREVYEACDTFGEMTDALGVDVTAQTVRRYMIKHGIHEPASNTASQTAEKLLDTNPESISVSSTEQATPETKSTGESTSQSEARGKAGERVVSADGHGGIRDKEQETELRTDEAAKPTDTVARDKQEESETNTGDTSTSTEETEKQTVEKAPPSTEDNTDGESPDSEITESDIDTEIGDALPDHLTLDDIKSTAQSANTLYEAQRQLNLDREEARELLQDLNLLDLVHGRVTTRDLTDRTIEDINRRLRSTVTPDQEQA